MTDAVQVHDVPAHLAALAEPHDYVDMFVATVAGASDRSAEDWARATIESASTVGRFLAWRAVCQLRPERGAAQDLIAGWRIADRGDQWIRVAARSWFLSAQMVFHVEQDRVAFLTFIRYDRSIGRVIWTAASKVHRAVAPDFLRGGVRSIRRTRETAV